MNNWEFAISRVDSPVEQTAIVYIVDMLVHVLGLGTHVY